MKQSIWKKPAKEWFPVSRHDTLISLVILGTAVLFCVLLLSIDPTGGYASMVFVLAVVCIARFTTGYFYSVTASFVGVICTNYIFTYPYWSLNFTIAGYPLTFIAMLAVSILTSALTTQLREHERIRAEVEKEKLRANLLRAVSHDIRTPLTSIVGSVSAILENGERIPENSKTELLTHIKEEAQWLITMVENLLSITRMNNEGATIIRQPEVLEEVVGGAIHKFRSRYQRVRVNVEAPEHVVMVSMDAVLIEQVFVNIMENAAIHGQNTTEIAVVFCETEDVVRVSITDNGGGVDPAVLPHVLDDSFALSREQRSDNRRNMGIGLSVCRAIVMAHEGTITASNVENGAQFVVAFPKEKEDLYEPYD